MKLDSRAIELIKQAGIKREIAGTFWTDGLFLGNGNLGITNFGESGLEWIVNKVDLYPAVIENQHFLTHSEVLKQLQQRPQKNVTFLGEMEPHDRISSTITAVHLRLKSWSGFGWYLPALPQFSQELSLYNGELKCSMNKAGMHVDVTSIAPRGKNAFILKIDENTPQKHNFVLEILRPVNEKFENPQWHLYDDCIAFEQKLPGEEVSYAVAICCNGLKLNEAGKSFHTVAIPSGSQIAVAVRTSRDCPEPLQAALDEARLNATGSFSVQRKENRAWWHNYWNNSWADFSNPQLNSYFYFSLYELACSFGKAPMPGLNGLTYGPKDIISTGANIQYYTHDQNAQIPLMAMMPLNRYRLIEVAADTYLSVAEQLKKETKHLFGCDGIRLPLCMKQDGREYSTGSYRYTLCGSAYTGFMLALAWRYSRDRVLMKEKLLPLLKEFIRFYASLMQKDEQGTYHLDYSVPPEIFTVTRDDTCILALLRPCIETVLEADELLQTGNPEERRLWQDILHHYPSLAQRPDGAWWCGPDIPLNHYMYSGHLFYPFFPTAASTDKKAARATLRYAAHCGTELSRTDMPGNFHFYHSWSQYNFTATAIRLGDIKLGWHGLHRFLELFAKPNGLFMHNAVIESQKISAAEKAFAKAPEIPAISFDGSHKNLKFDYEDVTANCNSRRVTPAVIEGSSEYLLMAAETLLQSWGGIIRLFPCVPKEFTGEFHNFLAEGGFLVSAAMEEGKLTFLQIQATHAGTFHLKLGKKEIIRHLKPHECFCLNQ